MYEFLELLAESVYFIHISNWGITTPKSSREVIRELQLDGWKEVRQRGSHKQFRHDEKPGLITVPHPQRDIPIGTLRSIEKVSGLKFT